MSPQHPSNRIHIAIERRRHDVRQGGAIEDVEDGGGVGQGGGGVWGVVEGGGVG